MTTPPPLRGWQPGDYRPPPQPGDLGPPPMPGWQPAGDYRPPTRPPKPPPGKRSWLAAAGCLVAVIVLAVVTNSHGNYSGSGGETAPASSSGDAPASAANVAPAGQVVRDGDFAFRVTGWYAAGPRLRQSTTPRT